MSKISTTITHNCLLSHYAERRRFMDEKVRKAIFLPILLMVLLIQNSCLSEGNLITYDEMKALLDDKGAMENTTVVDVRAQSEWAVGSIPNAINVEYETFIDQFGMMRDGGTALASIVTNKENKLVIYGSGSDHARLFASKAIQLGYKDVKFYAGGMADWREVHGDYLWITYEGFRQWYDTKCPFEDGANYLVDVHPPSLYIDYGHIPSAINIMSNYFASLDPDSVTDITDIITNKEASIIFYCVGAT
jgi:rhodanese-related sulfurtransferase